MADKQVKINETKHLILARNSNLAQQTMKDYIESMIVYFDKNGIAPKSMEDNPVAQITKVKDQLIGFIRTQEKTKLNPIIENLETNIDLLNDYLKEGVRVDDLTTESKTILAKIESVQKVISASLLEFNENVKVAKQTVAKKEAEKEAKVVSRQSYLNKKFDDTISKHALEIKEHRQDRKDIYALWKEFLDETNEHKTSIAKQVIFTGLVDRMEKFNKLILDKCL
jgi:hypothetical protein